MNSVITGPKSLLEGCLGLFREVCNSSRGQEGGWRDGWHFWCWDGPSKASKPQKGDREGEVAHREQPQTWISSLKCESRAH